ncbi:hypothetical protein ANN_19057 [Periplaneta americana]|uniref:RNase H type-1 domain-containing protein n=1 Tax=Periplaneta americana TaxID=6978 RepID=A0ABQ8SQF1_PERAM|nr:hypothetical protein ANN_19057 [Periplaneta americana]
MELREIYQICNTPEPLPQFLNPILSNSILFSVDLEDDVFKRKTPVDILRSLALETINLKYPETEWLRVYTDGSKSEDDINVGAGVYSDIFASYTAVDTHRSAYDGEIEAIRVALAQLICHQTKFKNVVILSDSKAAIESVGSSDPESSSIQDCQNAIQLLQAKHKIVVLQLPKEHMTNTGEGAFYRYLTDQEDWQSRISALQLVMTAWRSISTVSVFINIQPVPFVTFKKR